MHYALSVIYVRKENVSHYFKQFIISFALRTLADVHVVYGLRDQRIQQIGKVKVIEPWSWYNEIARQTSQWMIELQKHLVN